jgi:hypothetical protein
MLNLLSIQSLGDKERIARNRRFARIFPHSSVKTTPKDFLHQLSQKNVREMAEKLKVLLLEGIDVEEECFSPQLGVQIVAKKLSYVPHERRLYITHPKTPIASILSTSPSNTSLLQLHTSSSINGLEHIAEAENEEEEDGEDDEADEGETSSSSGEEEGNSFSQSGTFLDAALTLYLYAYSFAL